MSAQVGRGALLAGVIAPPLFVIVFLVDGAIHPDYNAMTDYVSELSRGELGWLQVLNFIILAVAMLTFAAGIRWGARRAPGSTAGAIIFAIIGALLVVGAIFTTDPHTAKVSSTTGNIHDLAALSIFAGVAIACFVFARRFQSSMRTYSVATGAFVVVAFIALAPVGRSLGIMGVTQRVIIIAGWAWITVLALALRAERAPTTAA
jgi:hypothetical membrane protein